MGDKLVQVADQALNTLKNMLIYYSLREGSHPMTT